jgi:hypothetical protein
MTGSPKDQARIEAEHSLAEKLMDLPLAALSKAGLVVRSYRAQVLKTSKSRPILRYDVACFDDRKEAIVRKVIVGKGCYRHDGARTFEFMRQLWSEGFSEDALLTIPEPIAYVPEPKLLLQGWASGDALYAYIHDPAVALEPVTLAARWLAKLHSTRLTGVPVLPPEYEETKLRTYGGVLMQICPEFAERIERFAWRIIASLETLDSRRFVPTHGDFQPKNVCVLRDRVTVIDFDRFALAHPARDLGHFIGPCMTMSYVRTGSFKEIEPWNAAFLDEYARLASPEAMSALPVFVARTFMEVLKHKVFLDPAKNIHLVPAWLDECERWLKRSPITEALPGNLGSLGVHEYRSIGG